MDGLLKSALRGPPTPSVDLFDLVVVEGGAAEVVDLEARVELQDPQQVLEQLPLRHGVQRRQQAIAEGPCTETVHAGYLSELT